MGRLIKDATLVVSKFLPAAAANNNSPTLDLGPGAYKSEEIEVEISVPALPANSDNSKAVAITLQESADDITYANTNPLIQTSVTGVTTTGSAAAVVRFRLPSGTKRYIQFNQSVVSGGGANTTVAVTYSLLF